MDSKQQLGTVDYIFIGISLSIPVIIGIRFRFTGGRQKTTLEYLLANKSALKFTVIMSTSVSGLSSVTMLGIPAEIYKYGAQLAVLAVSMMIGIWFSSHLFIPVYYRCNVSSIYEFLEMRFGKCTRYAISAVFIIQILPFTSVVLLSSVLALNAVTNISMEMAIIVCGGICTFYCVLGGMKAVLWTDTFQAALMLLCLTVIWVFGIREAGGLNEIYDRARDSNRFDFFDFRFDFTTRYTFWNTMCRGIILGMGIYGTNQLEVQRALSMSGCEKAQSMLRWSSLLVGGLYLLCSLFGLIMYAVFYLCDPVANREETVIKRYDQLVPYFIITRLQSIPGLTGICIAGLFGGALSTISSALNSLVTVTLIDFIQPTCSKYLTQAREIFIAKSLSSGYGIGCICITFAILNVHSASQAALTFTSIAEGPVLAVFLVGVLTTKASDKCSMFGFIIGYLVSSWIGYGTLISNYRYPILDLTTSGCLNNINDTILKNNSSVTCGDASKCPQMEYTLNTTSDVFILHRMSFVWIPVVGFVFTLATIFISSFLPGWNKNTDSKFLSPVAQYWTKTKPKENDRPHEFVLLKSKEEENSQNGILVKCNT